MPRLLNGRLVLHGVDIEALCWKLISTSGHVANLRAHERDDLCVELVEVSWELSLVYRPGEAAFSSWLTTNLRRRIIDYVRRTRGRTRWKATHLISEDNPDGIYERKLPDLVSLDGPDGNSLGASLATVDGNSAPDRLADGGRLFAERDRHRAEDLAYLG